MYLDRRRDYILYIRTFFPPIIVARHVNSVLVSYNDRSLVIIPAAAAVARSDDNNNNNNCPFCIVVNVAAGRRHTVYGNIGN